MSKYAVYWVGIAGGLCLYDLVKFAVKLAAAALGR